MGQALHPLMAYLIITSGILFLAAGGHGKEEASFLHKYRRAIQEYIMTGHESGWQHCDVLSASTAPHGGDPQISMGLDSIQSLLAELRLNQECNVHLIEQLHKLVEEEIAVPTEQVLDEDILPLVRAVPAAAPFPLFSGHNFCIGDHVEILNPNKKLHQANKGVIIGKTNGGDSGGFLCIQAGTA